MVELSANVQICSTYIVCPSCSLGFVQRIQRDRLLVIEGERRQPNQTNKERVAWFWKFSWESIMRRLHFRCKISRRVSWRIPWSVYADVDDQSRDYSTIYAKYQELLTEENIYAGHLQMKSKLWKRRWYSQKILRPLCHSTQLAKQ